MAQDFGTEVGTSLIYEDGTQKVWLLDLDPGEATAWHRHDFDYVFVVTDAGTVQTEYADGSVEIQDGDAVGHSEYRRRDIPHRLVNTGESRYRNIVVELKRA